MRNEWSAMKKLIWLKRAVLSAANAILKTVSGLAPLLLENAVANPIHSLTQYGKCTQSGTPTPDAPVDIVCNNGVLKPSPNLCNSALYTGMGYYVSTTDKVTNSSSNGTLVFQCKPNTTYSWWHTDGAGGSRAFELPTDTVTIGQAATWAVGNPAYSQKNTVRKYTTSADAKLLCVLFGRIDAQVDRTMDEQLADFMLVEGDVSTATEYVPYGVVYAGGYSIGKNLANVNAQTALVGYYITTQGVVTADLYNWMYQPYIRVKPNTTYTLSMSQSVYYVSISEYSKADDSGFIVRKAGSTGSNTSLTITTGATTNYIRFGTNLDRTAVTLEEVLAINWQVEEGATATEYEPYTEIPYLPEVLTVSGANLLDPSTVPDENRFISSSNGSTQAPSAAGGEFRHSEYIPVKEGTTYFFGMTPYAASSAGIAWYSTAEVTGYISGLNGSTLKNSNNNMRATAPAGAKYLRFCWRINEGYDPDWQHSVYPCECVNNEPIMSAWQAYAAPQTASVPMLLSVGDYKDEAEIISGGMTHRVGIKVLDGTEAWRASTSANIYILDSAIAVNLTAICTHFQKVSNTTSAANMPDGSFKGHSSNAILYFKDVSAGNVDGFKAFLAVQYAAGTPVIVLYKLAEETTGQTTAQHLVTHEGTNIVDVASNVDPVELKAEYYATE